MSNLPRSSCRFRIQDESKLNQNIGIALHFNSKRRIKNPSLGAQKNPCRSLVDRDLIRRCRCYSDLRVEFLIKLTARSCRPGQHFKLLCGFLMPLSLMSPRLVKLTQILNSGINSKYENIRACDFRSFRFLSVILIENEANLKTDAVSTQNHTVTQTL